LDSPKLDKLYQETTTKLSASYRKVNGLIEKGKTAEAALEFKSSFSPQVKKFYSEAALTAPKRYLEDCQWNAKARSLYITTRKTETALTQQDQNAASSMLAELREFFFKLHRSNKMLLTNDAVYEFFKTVQSVPGDKTALAQYNSSKLGGLKAKIAKAKPSTKVKADNASYETAYKAWSAEVDKILSKDKLDPRRAEKLKSITGEFYKQYGMDFE
jgi:hypothetical protein